LGTEFLVAAERSEAALGLKKITTPPAAHTSAQMLRIPPLGMNTSATMSAAQATKRNTANLVQANVETPLQYTQRSPHDRHRR